MARVNVYLPDELAAEAREAGLNVSGLAQGAIQAALTARRLDGWLDSVDDLTPVSIDGAAIAAAISAAKSDLETRG